MTDRDLRQKECFLKWKSNGGKGCIVAATGSIVTRTSINLFKIGKPSNYIVRYNWPINYELHKKH